MNHIISVFDSNSRSLKSLKTYIYKYDILLNFLIISEVYLTLILKLFKITSIAKRKLL